MGGGKDHNPILVHSISKIHRTYISATTTRHQSTLNRRIPTKLGPIVPTQALLIDSLQFLTLFYSRRRLSFFSPDDSRRFTKNYFYLRASRLNQTCPTPTTTIISMHVFPNTVVYCYNIVILHRWCSVSNRTNLESGPQYFKKTLYKDPTQPETNFVVE